ncbi:MAG: hypothetical protein ACTHMS_05205 [Jatrophihabitans sp.]|uniref:hypothetical protein n=1 Tax=Jatrophihabitans sp. TaxID=1932789 RepID=UPI003F81DF48
MKDVSERIAMHDAVFGALLDKVRQDRYPSTQQLDLLEQHLVGHERQEFVEVLLEKVRQDRYPSMQLVHRVLRLSG